MKKWLILVGFVLLTWSFMLGQQQAYYFRMPVISDDGNDVLYQAIPVTLGQPSLDIFQMPPNAMSTLGMRVFLNGAPMVLPGQFQDAARPHFSVSQGLHIVYIRGGNGFPLQVYLYDRQKDQEMLISRIGNTPASNHSVCPRINKNGRIVVFASLDQNLHDPNGDGISDPLPVYATPTSSAPWVIYVHDRDVDGNGTYDEIPPDPTVVTVATYAVAVASSPYVALSPDTGGTYIAYQVYNPSATPPSWGLFVKDWRNNIVTDPPVAVSQVAFSVPSVIGIIQPVSGALVAFSANTAFNGNRAGVWLAEVDFTQTPPVVGLLSVSLNNGVNGAPVISPDANFLAFHTTASDVIPNLNDRNGVDDIYVFDLTTLTPIWSTLLVRNVPSPSPLPPIGSFDPCVHPSLSSLVGNSLFIAFEHWWKDPTTGRPQIFVRKAQIQPSTNLLFAIRPTRARRYVPLK